MSVFGPFDGVKVFYSPHALEKTEDRLFPASKHRSKRIYKKLLKRFGGEYRVKPSVFMTPHGVLVHPDLKRDFEAATGKP